MRLVGLYPRSPFAYGKWAPQFAWVAFLLVMIGAATPCRAAQPLPAYLTLPPQVNVNMDSLVYEDYGEAEFIVPGHADPVVQRGRHWNVNMKISGLAPDAEQKAIWLSIRPALVQGGWTMLAELDQNPFTATMRYQKNGKDAWASLGIFGADDMRMDLVEIALLPLKFTLLPPAATPENVSADSGDFPYLAPLPGSEAGDSNHEDGPMLVPSDQDGGEMQSVGSGSIKKGYSVAAGLSTLLFATAYHDALTRAGWTIIQLLQGVHQSDAAITAHYAAHGRDIWAYLHADGGNGYVIQVADAGAEDFGTELDRDCHVALYGIHFDFNKATLRPDSDPVLQKVLALLKSRPDLKLEVQGHTDNVGGDDYNQKLSDARANAVVDWLRAKGIAANRLSAHGYGLTMPIADNGTDEGRAKNRRVELKKQGCGN